MNEYFNKLLKSRNEQNRNSAFYHYDSHTRKNYTKATTIKNKSITRRIEATAIIEERISMLLLKNKKSNNKDKMIKSKSKPNNHNSVFISTVSPQPSRVNNHSFETPKIEIKSKALIQFKQLNTLTKSSHLKNSIDSLPLNNLPLAEHPLTKIKQYNPSETQSSYSYSPFLTAKNYKSSRSPSPIVIQKANKSIINPNILQKKKALKSLSIDTNKKETFKYFNSSNHRSFIHKTNSNQNINSSSFRSNRPKNDVIVVTKLTKRSSVPIFRNSSTNKITDKSSQKNNISVILKKRKITNLYKAPKIGSHNISQPDDQPNLSKEHFSRRNSKSTNKTSRSILCTSSTIMIQKKISNIGHFTKTGFAGFGVYKTNQDNYFITELPENSIHYFGIW